MNENTQLSPKKDYFAPMHTAEHILNQTMVRVFGCERSKVNHIEKNKSKCDYFLPSAPTDEELQEVAHLVKDVIKANLPVFSKIVSRQEAAKLVDLSSLPAEAGEEVRLVFVGEYDICPCIGQHVENTREIGHFVLSSHSFENGKLRIRFKLEDK